MKKVFIISTIIILFFLSLTTIFKTDYIFTENDEEIKSFIPADDWFEKQRAYPFENIPNEEYLKALDYVKKNMTTGSMYRAPWTLAGPINIEGRITTIAIHPTNPQIVYTGLANGGVWKSTNFCQSWVSVFDNQNTSSIGALAIDPNNPNILYCGTGESNSLRSYYPGTGIYKSTDAGNTWTFQALANSYAIGNISINPLNTQEVYAAVVGALRQKTTERGVYKTTNGGINWNNVLYIADSVGAIDVVVDPVNPSRVFAAMWQRFRRESYISYGGPQSALYLSTNSGLNWTVVSGGFPSNASDLGRISLDICKTRPNYIYALLAYANGNTRGVYKSSNGGTNWTQVSTSAGGSSNYAWFNRFCKVNPNDSNIVYVGGLGSERSTNGGTSFSSVSYEHVDFHALCFAPSNSTYIVKGNDGGIESSTNSGTSWTYSHTLPVTQFYAGEINYSNPNVILGGAQDNGTVRTTTGGLSDWTDITGGDGFYCLIDYNNQNNVYAETQNAGIVRSTNGGTSFMSGTSGLDITFTNWSTPFVMDKNNPQILYCGTYKVHKTTNGMASWTAISPDLANAHVANLGTITTVDAAKSNSNVVYAGTDDANVWVTQNGGTNWTKINTGLPNRWVTRVTVHPDSANVCYVTLSGYKIDTLGAHIYRTTNYGTNWTSIKGNLPDAPINDVIISPYDKKTLYIGTDVGVMYSTNYGTNWYVLGTGFPTNVPCHDLTLHQPTGKLVVWTHGRSAFSTTILTGINNIGNNIPEKFSLYQNYPNPFNPVTKIKFDVPTLYKGGQGGVSIKIFDILGKEIQTLVNEQLNPGTYEVTFDGSNLPSGIYFYQLRVGDFVNTKKMLLIK